MYFIKLAGLYHWDILKSSLYFGDLDLIFKVTVLERLSDCNRKKKKKIVCTLLNLWLDSGQTSIHTSPGLCEELVRFW